MNDLISYFTISYSLFAGNELLDKSKPIYSADIVAETEEEAVKKLKDDFKMMHVQVLAASGKKTMTKEEYDED